MEMKNPQNVTAVSQYGQGVVMINRKKGQQIVCGNAQNVQQSEAAHAAERSERRGFTPQQSNSTDPHSEARSRPFASINAYPTTKAEVRNLRKPQNEWEQQDYAYFTEQFNSCTHLKDIKKLVGLERQKDIGAICMKCDLLGLPIDKEKMKDIFLNESGSRCCSRILKVGKNRCLRISGTMTSQCGLELHEGQQFEFSYMISQDGKKVITLTLLE